MAVFLPAIVKSWARMPSFTTTNVTVPRGTVFGVSTNANSVGLPASTRTVGVFACGRFASAGSGHKHGRSREKTKGHDPEMCHWKERLRPG